MTINIDRKKRRGRNALDDPRTHCISVRVNDAELELIESKLDGMAKGEWLRCAALDTFRPIIPEINKQQWIDLAKLAGNVNQIARALNRNGIQNDDQLNNVRSALTELRNRLVGL